LRAVSAEQRITAVFSANIIHCFFYKSPNASLIVENHSFASAVASLRQLIDKFQDLDTELEEVFGQSFCSRSFPPQMLRILDIKHVKEIILFTR
jgi:hypothetical protein